MHFTKPVALLALLLSGGHALAQPAAVEERSIAELSGDLHSGRSTSVQLVQAFRRRIETMDRVGPALHSVISLSGVAIQEARQLDDERRAGHLRGPLHGIPVLIKDNIETRELPTTAGSLALAENRTGRDAFAVARLRAAGAIVLGKANLSEWAQIRSMHAPGGWSALGGLTRNPYALDRSACGSSSGAAAAVAASFAAASLGTETNASIVCPAAVTGLVGLKPTVGLVSRTHIVPLSPSQDVAGPIARSVADAALLLTAIAGTDPTDPSTAEADARRQDYAASLQPQALQGARLGVVRSGGVSPATMEVFETALAALRQAGAELVEIGNYDEVPARERQLPILLTEFRASIDAYLPTLPASVHPRTLEQLIAFNRAEPRETAAFDQSTFERALAAPGIDDPGYRETLATARRLAGADGIDRLLREHRVTALVAPSASPTAVVDLVNGSRPMGMLTSLPAIAGYPHLTVPMGLVKGLPVGLSLIGPAWSEATLLAYGYAFEQQAKARRPPTYAITAAALRPYRGAGIADCTRC